MTEKQAKLLAYPFTADEIEWRILLTTKDKSKGQVAAYIDSRAIQKRLDDVLGRENWKNHFITMPGSSNSTTAHICEISIYYPDRQEWITKSDGAGSTDIEPIKGGLSNAFKRAASIWNIGRYLYELPGHLGVAEGRPSILIPRKAQAHQTLQPVCQPIPESSADSGTEEGFRTDGFSLHFRPVRCHPACVRPLPGLRSTAGHLSDRPAQPDAGDSSQHPGCPAKPGWRKGDRFYQGPAFLTGRPEPSQPENCC